jgi:hypothetical protein
VEALVSSLTRASSRSGADRGGHRDPAAPSIGGQIGGADEPDDLTDAVRAIEEALDSRHPLLWEAVQTDLLLAMLNAEHASDRSTSSPGCLVCRRLADGLPDAVRQLVGLEPVR